MASSDVIELGSSEDEAEPVPKKKKPALNAMVHIPKELPGLAVKPVVLPNLQKVLAGGAITITNVKKTKVPPQVNKAKPNGKPAQVFMQRAPLKMPMIRNPVTIPITINKLSVNPLNVMKKPQHIRLPTPKLSLPPGITIKRTAASSDTQNRSGITTTKRKPNMKRKIIEKMITTVELDDEEVPLTYGSSPQWYLRPEEQSLIKEIKEDESIDNQEEDDMKKNYNMELANNKEPEKTKYIEITIEDSPIKPLQVRKGFEVGSELPITIEDSPIKPLKCSTGQPSDSDPEIASDTEPQSKKRLDYPKDEEVSETPGTQNIEDIDMEVVPSVDESKEQVESRDGDANEMKNDNETPKRTEATLISKEVKDAEKSSKPNAEQKQNIGEFHPVYQKFIDLCFELENSDDMTKIVEKKIKTYYRQCPKDYVESELFTDMVTSKIFAMKGAPDKMFLYIKDVVDDLNLQRKSAKAVEVSNKENNKTDDGEYDSKRRRQIRKLDKTIKKLHRVIQKLEKQEVKFEDEENSVYLMTERYKERLIKVHAKYCQLTNTKMPSEPRIQIDARPGVPAGPAKRLEKWVNKKVPIGAPLPCPDFQDVLRCVREANEEERLGWNEADIMAEARDLFVRCGKKIQRRRQENEWRIAASRISHEDLALDPAKENDDLKKKLEYNKIIAAQKETEVLNKYADKQSQLKLVGEEIGDKEAEESPVESEEDDGNDESNSLEDKQKRKERLKRLLHEKTMKTSSEKENITCEIEVQKNEVVVEGEENIEGTKGTNTVSEKTEEQKENVQNLVNDTKERSNEAIKNISEDKINDDLKNEKTNNSDRYDVDSDIDELHLLQKLYSENEMNSSTEGSDSDTTIAISDTLESDSDDENVKIQQNDDIISIENSSYSESEETKDECESTKVAEETKDKKIDDWLLQNAEVMLVSSTPGKQMNVDQENILLTLSEENLSADNAEDICAIKTSNDGSANDDCEIISDNCDNNSTDNDAYMCEAPLDIDLDNVNEFDDVRVTANNFDNDVLNSNEHHSSKKSNLGLDGAEIELRNSLLVSVEDSQDNNTNVVVMDVSCDESNSVTSDIVCENNTRNFEIDNKWNENSSDKNSLQDQSPTDGVELNTIPSNTHSETHSVEQNDELCSEFDMINDNEESTSNSIKANKEQDVRDYEVMDVNLDIASDETTFLNEQNSEDGKVASVEC